jgi:predicted metal-dependent phosphoesterase TrpH
MEQRVASLQESNVEVGEMKELQPQDQTKIIGLHSELEEVNRKATISQQDLRRCKIASTTVETKLASFSTKEESSKQFDHSEQMIAGAIGLKQTAGNNKNKQITGKRKDVVTDIEAIGTSDEEESYADTQEFMEPEYMENIQASLLLENEGSDDHTNNRQGTETPNMQVK